MRGTPQTFWGKLTASPSDGVTAWHPLVDHCADVAACAEKLLSLPTWRARLAGLCGRDDLDEITRSRLSVLAALHDIGKFNIGFQAKGRPELGTTAGHVRQALPALNRPVCASLSILNGWGDGTPGLLVSALCHHGRPYPYSTTLDFEPVLWSPCQGLDPKAGIDSLVGATKAWFPKAFRADGPALPDDPAFEHAFAGLVMLADWLGSDQEMFPFSEPQDGDRIDRARKAAASFAADSWLAVDSARRRDREAVDFFERISGYSPSPFQESVTALGTTESAAITVVEAETGSGKTETALARFVALFSDGAVDGMYFALPTRTAATQMHQRIVEAMRRAFTAPPPVVLAVPGYLRVDDVQGERQLAGFDVLWPDEGRYRYRGWAAESPKRFLAGCVVVGTIDQVLLSALRVKHAHLRATALLRQLLVVDEVHASDPYMTRILEEVLARHVRAGGHALLLSATLGGEARERLLHVRAQPDAPSLAEAERAPYPLISTRQRNDRDGVRFAIAAERIIQVSVQPSLEDVDTVAREALDAAKRGAKVLVIKNTVTDCIATQESVERLASADGVSDLLFSCNDTIVPHHSRFAREDREQLDRAIDTVFGKGSKRDGGCVVVATQTVQQSLDLDADLLISDLCPMDVLLQRTGRLHRHSRGRPTGFEEPCARVLVPRDRDLGILLNDAGRERHHHGLGSVYSDLRILEATWQLLERHPTWRIPAMNRHLVEQSLHSAALADIASARDERWRAHAERMDGVRRGESRQAELNLVDWTKPYSEDSFADDERITSRLDEGDRRAQFRHAVVSPLGQAVTELTIRAAWARGVPSDEWEAHVVDCAGGTTRFRYGDRSFVYDRHGLRLDQPTALKVADDDGP